MGIPYCEPAESWAYALGIKEQYAFNAPRELFEKYDGYFIVWTMGKSRHEPYWHELIVPAIERGKRILISAHGNSLRALVKYLDNISDQEILSLNIPTGIPLVYELDENLKPRQSYYLGDPEQVKEAMEAIARQGKAR